MIETNGWSIPHLTEDESKIAVIDLETTGLDPTDCIVEVGVCELDTETGDVQKLLDMVVKEDRFCIDTHRYAWVFDHSSLKAEDIVHAAPWKFAARELNQLLEEYPVTAFNKAFDLAFLRVRDLVPKVELPCPMVKATNVLKIPGPYGYKWPTLEEAWEHYMPGLDYEEQHRAFDDALHEALLIWAMHNVGDYAFDKVVIR